ncbi:sensor histidine kinase [Phocaeicola sp.]
MANHHDQIGSEDLLQLLEMAHMGWWQLDCTDQVYVCSDFIAQLLGLSSNTISYQDFQKFVHEDYRELLDVRYLSDAKGESSKHKLRIYTKCGIQWAVFCIAGKKEETNGHPVVWGYLKELAPEDESRVVQQVRQRMESLLYQQNAMSRSLLSLAKTENMNEVINKILKDVLVQFNSERVYIFEFDFKGRTHSCTYEAVSDPSYAEQQNLQCIEMDESSWWSTRLLSGNSIVLSSLEELPRIAQSEYEVLAAQHIKSIMAVPLVANEKTWGYIGVDMVRNYRQWTNEDFQWFSSLSNIISICIELYQSREKARADKLEMDKLYKHMPMGYIRMKLLYAPSGEVVDALIEDANETFETITGLSKEDLLGKTTGGVYMLTPDKLDELSTLHTTKKSIEMDLRLTNGRYIHCIIYTPLPDTIVTLFTDMTESIMSREILDRNEKILSNIYRNIPVGIELYDKDGYMVDINNKDMEIFGVKRREDVLGLNVFSNPLIPSKVIEALEQKEPIDFRLNYAFKKVGTYYDTDNRGEIDLLTRVTTLYDSKGDFLNYLFINIDNTETSNAFYQIQEFQEMFSVIADFAEVGFVCWNPLKDEGFAIEQWFKNYNTDSRDVKEILGIYPTLHPEDREMMVKTIQDLCNGKISKYSSELRVITPDGTPRWLRSTMLVRKYEPENDIIDIVGVNFNITELKEAESKLIVAKEKAEQSDRLKSAFLANMSHEIRTPLNAIVGFSNLLIDADDLEERKQYMAVVEENTDLLLQLISDILDLAKVEAGTFEMVETEVDVNQLCMDIVQAAKMKAPECVEVRFEPGSDDFQFISAKNRIHQVISNFVNNAVKFTSNGSITVGYILRKSEIEFYVQDTGIGIPQERQSEIFGRFVKLNSFIHGTGLGLSICESIVRQLGGQIGVRSEVGKGSRFWFTHPFTEKNCVSGLLPEN